MAKRSHPSLDASSESAPALTMRDVRRVAAQYGATVEDASEGHWIRFHLTAPDGQQWACAEVHSLTIQWEPRQGPAVVKQWRQSQFADAIRDMEYGLVPCEPDCDCGLV